MSYWLENRTFNTKSKFYFLFLFLWTLSFEWEGSSFIF